MARVRKGRMREKERGRRGEGGEEEKGREGESTYAKATVD